MPVLVPDRKEKIVELCTNKSVLHLGFIQHSHLYEKLIADKNWLHEKINTVAANLVGIDYLGEDVNIIRAKYNYECYYGDVTKLDRLSLDKKFDVIICGELIEHVENAGLMLDGIKKFMYPNSILIITTPNPWSRSRIKLISDGVLEDEWLNKEHTCWYSFGTLKQLLARKGFSEIKYGYYNEKVHNDKTNILIKKLRSLYRKINPVKEYYANGLFFITKMNSVD